MKRPIVLTLLCALVLFAMACAADQGNALGRLHPALRMLLSSTESAAVAESGLLNLQGASKRFQITISPTGIERIGVLVKLRDAVASRSYRSLPVLGRAGSILALSATVAELFDLAADPNVIYIEPSWKTSPALDLSVPEIGASAVHAASPSVVGEGVVIGVVDTGIDYSHLDFRFDSDGDGFEESSRIEAIWDQTWGIFGAEYDRAEIESDIALGLGPETGSVRASDRDGHGTHVTSIAAGDGSSSPYGFVGVALESAIVAVKTTFFTADIISAVEYVFDRADALGLPAVVNLSLGGHEGPHDGTSLFEEGLDQLTAAPGRVVVVSAGNEGNLAIHASSTLLGGATSFIVEPDDWEVELSVWYPGTSSFTVTVDPPFASPISVPTGGNTGFVITTDGTVHVDNASAGVNPNNGDHHAAIRLANVAVGSSWRIEISDAGGGGRFDAWVTSGTASILGGDSASTIDEPGNADRVITVGSYNTKSSWPSLAGTQDYSGAYPVGPLSAFSSQGPTRDGRTKPDICAPGAWICAAASADALALQYLTHPDGVHMVELGTSMAAPHVSGAIALLLGLDPGLTASEARGILTGEAASDSFTGSLPNERWGWGKLDVVAAVDAVGTAEPPEPPPGPSTPLVTLDENPVEQSARFMLEIPAGTSSATLRVYTVSGSLAFETGVAPQSREYVWDLRSTSGEPLAVGLYLYVLVTDVGASSVGRLVIER